MKVQFSKHALLQMEERGATRSEVVKAIEYGEEIPAKKGRRAFRYNFQFVGSWIGKRFRIKQVKPIIVKENSRYVVITVHVFYF